jgi:hypothetical protein
MAKSKADAPEPEQWVFDEKVLNDLKAWVRREIALASVGHTVEERETENP